MAPKQMGGRKPKKETFGLDVRQLKMWNQLRTQQQLDTEAVKQEIAVAKVRGFLDAIASVIRLQSWWRMVRVRRKYEEWLADRRAVKRKFYRSWRVFWRSERMFMHQVLGKYMAAWRDEVEDEQRLKRLVTEFFKNCLKRMRLSPQACMAFFNPGEWSDAVAPADMLKIRRMMLLKLFEGWRMESRELKNMRYKASQILARMMRRTRGPLWVKESALVCFHMWHRYVAVKNAYRKGEPDPRFTNPFLPQWTMLFKHLTLARVKKKRTLEAGQLLTQRRAMAKWVFLMTVDRSKPVTPLAVAISHYHRVLSTKVLTGWFDVVRERGRMSRYREKIFYIWKTWAPRHRKLRDFNHLACEWLRIQRQRKSFNVMINICLVVVGARTEKIKELRRNFCDRKVAICSYGLLNKDEHVLMVDCWRRLMHFHEMRKNWKAFNWHFNYEYHCHRARAILRAWRGVVLASKAESSTIDPAASPSGRASPTSLVDDNSTWADNSLMDDSSVGSASSLQSMVMMDVHGNLVAPKKKKKSPKDFGQLLAGFSSAADHLFEEGRMGRLQPVPGPYQLFLFGLAIAYMHRRLPEIDSRPVEDVFSLAVDRFKHSPTIPNLAALVPHGAVAAPSVTTMGTGPEASEAAYDPGSRVHRAKFIRELWRPELQAKLQRAVDEVDLSVAVDCIAQGAIVQNRLVRQVAPHLGDHYLPLFTTLLLGSLSFIASRIIGRDRDRVVNECNNPIGAFFLGSHVARWEKGELTTRELSSVTQNMLGTELFGGRHRARSLWRMLTLHFLDKKAEELGKTCVQLSANRTVDEEVGEILKRNRVERLISMRCSISELLGNPAPWTVEERKRMVLPDLVSHQSHYRHSIFQSAGAPGTTVTRSIYHVLREYTLLTGRLANEARALRAPLLERDQRLLVNGFMAQSRKDMQLLREERMTPAQKEELRLKNEREELKRQKAADKELQRKRKQRRKELQKRRGKKGKKGKKGGSTPMPAETEDSDVDGGESDGGADGYATYDEAEFDSDKRFVVRDLFEGLQLSEEAEVLDERSFQQRVGPLSMPTYGETWLPDVWKGDARCQVLYARRIKTDVRMCVKRVLHALQLDELDQTAYEALRNKDKGLGFHLVGRALSDEAYRNAEVWYATPSDYFSFRRLKERMVRELATMEGLVASMKQTLGACKLSTLALDEDVTTYDKFLKTARREILMIAEKQQGKQAVDQEGRAGKLAQVAKVDRALAQTRKGLQDRTEKVRLANVLVATGNLDGVFDLLARPKSSDSRPPSRGGKVKEDRSNMAAFKLIEDAKASLSSFKAQIEDLEGKKKIAEAELREYNSTCMRTSRLLQRFAVERFDTMVEVQELLVRTWRALDRTGDDKEELRARRLAHFMYLRVLQRFFQQGVVEKGLELTRSAEAKKMAELLNAPGDGDSADGERGPPPRLKQLKSGRLQSRRHLSRTASMTGSLPAKDDYAVASSSSTAAAVAGGAPREEERRGTTELAGPSVATASEEQTTSTAYSNTDSSAKGLEGPSEVTGVDADLGREEEEEEFRPLTVDEEIAWLHYNSPEERAKRERELQELTQRQAEEMASQDLRIRTFDEYWQSYPRKEKPDKGATKAKTPKAGAAAAAIVMDDEVSQPKIIRNRTEKMWNQVGQAHWREKAEQIKALIQQTCDLTGADPDSLRNLRKLRVIPKDGPDPLDEEFDLRESARTDEDPALPSEHELTFYIPYQHLQNVVWFHGSANKLRTATKLSVSLRELHLLHRKMSEASSASEEGSVGSASASAASAKTEEAKVDEFAATGQTEYFRLKQGYLSRVRHAAAAGKGQFSVAARTGRALIMREMRGVEGVLEFSDELLEEEDDLTETSSLATMSLTERDEIVQGVPKFLDAVSPLKSPTNRPGLLPTHEEPAPIAALTPTPVSPALAFIAAPVLTRAAPEPVEAPKSAGPSATEQDEDADLVVPLGDALRSLSEISLGSASGEAKPEPSAAKKAADEKQEKLLKGKLRPKARAITFAASMGNDLLKATMRLTQQPEAEKEPEKEGPSVQLRREASQLLSTGGMMRASSFMMGALKKPTSQPDVLATSSGDGDSKGLAARGALNSPLSFPALERSDVQPPAPMAPPNARHINNLHALVEETHTEEETTVLASAVSTSIQAPATEPLMWPRTGSFGPAAAAAATAGVSITKSTGEPPASPSARGSRTERTPQPLAIPRLSSPTRRGQSSPVPSSTAFTTAEWPRVSSPVRRLSSKYANPLPMSTVVLQASASSSAAAAPVVIPAPTLEFSDSLSRPGSFAFSEDEPGLVPSALADGLAAQGLASPMGYKAIKDSRGHWNLRPSSSAAGTGTGFSDDHALFLPQPSNPLQVAGKAFIFAEQQPATPPATSSRLHTPQHYYQDELLPFPGPTLLEALGMDPPPSRPRELHQGPLDLRGLVRELRPSSAGPRESGTWADEVNPFEPRMSFFPGHFRQRAANYEPSPPTSRPGSSRLQPRTKSGPGTPSTPGTPGGRSKPNSALGLTVAATPATTPATTPARGGGRAVQPERPLSAVIFDDESLDDGAATPSRRSKTLTWDAQELEQLQDTGSRLPRADVQALADELRRFVRSRHDALAYSPPKTRGRLMTRDSHARDMRVAQDSTTNFYAQLVPSPSSPDYSLTVRDFKGRVLTRARAASPPVSPGPPLSPGAGDFWTSAGLADAGAGGFFGGAPSLPDGESLGEDELLVAPAAPASLAQDKQTRARRLVVRGQPTGPPPTHLKPCPPLPQPSAPVIEGHDELSSLRAFASTDDASPAAIRALRRSSAPLALTGHHVTSLSALARDQLAAQTALLPGASALTSSCQTSSQIIRDIAGDHQYVVHMTESADGDASEALAPAAPVTSAAATAGLVLDGDRDHDRDHWVTRGAMGVGASAMAVTALAQPLHPPRPSSRAAPTLVAPPSAPPPVLAPAPSPATTAPEVLGFLGDGCSAGDGLGEDEEDDEEWEREAEQELRRAFSLSALPPARPLPFKSAVDLQLDLSRSQVVARPKMLGRRRKVSRLATLPPLTALAARAPGSPGRPLVLGEVTGSSTLVYKQAPPGAGDKRKPTLRPLK